MNNNLRQITVLDNFMAIYYIFILGALYWCWVYNKNSRAGHIDMSIVNLYIDVFHSKGTGNDCFPDTLHDAYIKAQDHSGSPKYAMTLLRYYSTNSPVGRPDVFLGGLGDFIFKSNLDVIDVDYRLGNGFVNFRFEPIYGKGRYNVTCDKPEIYNDLHHLHQNHFMSVMLIAKLSAYINKMGNPLKSCKSLMEWIAKEHREQSDQSVKINHDRNYGVPHYHSTKIVEDDAVGIEGLLYNVVFIFGDDHYEIYSDYAEDIFICNGRRLKSVKKFRKSFNRSIQKWKMQSNDLKNQRLI